ncbi:TIR-like protein FxsC [Sphaerisporangium corydalis]|uniref:TIR-like protein FxsC n=1 Tax=Sphaerisporangium corydalis TaxID=1441875 RepID=A0ABV9EIR6_9ACTN|nr:TIR-like protein FxsC [Sphaerisporangium corydalis]
MVEHVDDRRGGDSQAAESTVYFFMSHAHVKYHRLIDDDPGRYVMNFFRDLCSHIMQMTDCPAALLPGYVDLGMRSGIEWDPEIKHALGSCRVFVPLYAPRYFRSEYCGMEWDAFYRRESRHRAESIGNSTQRAIVPVLWTALDLDGAPEVAKRIQFASFDMDTNYRRHGIYGLVSTNKWDDYDSVTYQIAREIVLTAELTRLRPCDPSIFLDMRNVFLEDAQGVGRNEGPGEVAQ